MPNEINNKLSIPAPDEEVVEKLLNGTQLDFNKIIPIPGGTTRDILKDREELWGCKWGASETHRLVMDGHIRVYFKTAWSPPIKVIQRVTELFPGTEAFTLEVNDALELSYKNLEP